MKRQTVLIVDDTPANIQLLSEILGEEYEVIFATNGEDALMLSRQQHPDLVLLDVMMPVMDGYQVCARLKADPETREIPVIFVTALCQEDDEVRGLELGAIDYITKPISPQVARARVKNHLEVKRYRDLLEHMATAADRAKKEFLRSINHELKTPLTPILGMTDLVLNSEGDQSKRKYLSMVQSAALKLLGMVEDLIETSRLEGEGGTLEVDSFRLKDFLSDLMQELSSEAKAKGLQLILKTAPDLPEAVQSDQWKLHKVLKTLLENAFKFTQEGQISLTVVVRREREGEFLRFSVQDTGIGLKDGEAEWIFGDFIQSDGTVSRAYPGLGLGLGLARRLVVLLGGRIWAEPALPSGTIFHVELPKS